MGVVYPVIPDGCYCFLEEGPMRESADQDQRQQQESTFSVGIFFLHLVLVYVTFCNPFITLWPLSILYGIGCVMYYWSNYQIVAGSLPFLVFLWVPVAGLVYGSLTYATGTARIDTFGLAVRSSDVIRGARAYTYSHGCVIDGSFENIFFYPTKNLAIRQLGEVLGPMPGAYPGPYPSEDQQAYQILQKQGKVINREELMNGTLTVEDKTIRFSKEELKYLFSVRVMDPLDERVKKEAFRVTVLGDRGLLISPYYYKPEELSRRKVNQLFQIKSHDSNQLSLQGREEYLQLIDTNTKSHVALYQYRPVYRLH